MSANEAFALGHIREQMTEIAVGLDAIVIDFDLAPDPLNEIVMGTVFTRHTVALADYLEFFTETRPDLVDPLRRDNIMQLLTVLRREEDGERPAETMRRQANALYVLIKIMSEVEKRARLEALSQPLGLDESTLASLLETGLDE